MVAQVESRHSIFKNLWLIHLFPMLIHILDCGSAFTWGNNFWLLAQLSLEEINANFRLYHMLTCQSGLHSFVQSIIQLFLQQMYKRLWKTWVRLQEHSFLPSQSLQSSGRYRYVSRPLQYHVIKCYSGENMRTLRADERHVPRVGGPRVASPSVVMGLEG